MSDIQEIKYWLDLMGGSVRGAVSQLVEWTRILRKEVVGKHPNTHSHPFKTMYVDKQVNKIVIDNGDYLFDTFQ